jgi:hypothetical protein
VSHRDGYQGTNRLHEQAGPLHAIDLRLADEDALAAGV